jgi:hypothetical protein
VRGVPLQGLKDPVPDYVKMFGQVFLEEGCSSVRATVGSEAGDLSEHLSSSEVTQTYEF